MKKIILILCFLLASQGAFVSAEEKIPSPFWKLIKEEAALEAGDDLQAQINNWLDIIELFNDWSDSSQRKLEIVTPRLQMIIANYESLKDYDQALVYLELYIKNASLLESMGLWNEDARIWAESKITNLRVDIDLFVTTEIEEPIKPLAMYEPSHGLYYGATYDLDPSVKKLTDVGHIPTYPKENSTFLIYLDFGQDIKTFDWYIRQAKEAGSGVLLAWNAYEVYSDMSQHKDYINETAAYLKTLDIPVFLRYAGEFNIADGFEDHEGFVENFQYLTTLVRKQASNVAMVWSPNDISAFGRDHEDYYPGDAFVDWVGISTYTSYYMGSKKDYGSLQDSVDNNYFTGTKANPLSKIEDIVTTYGHKKPIMITENGVAHYSKVANEDFSSWAQIQLQRAYAYIPLKYPQVKGIFYFNAHVAVNTKSIFALYENEAIQKTFVDLTASDVYLPTMATQLTHYPYSVNEKNRVVTEPQLNFQTLLILPNVLEPRVKYHLNEKEVLKTSLLPYHFTLDQSDLKEGYNTLTLEILDDQDSTVKTISYTLFKKESKVAIGHPKQLIFKLNDDTVVEQGMPIKLTASPFLKEGSSMVPLRYIGEALGATVSWDNESQSATYEKDGLTMKVTLDKTTAYVNGQPIVLSVAPTLVSGSTFVPIRVISEYFGAQVTWQGEDQSITIDIF